MMKNKSDPTKKTSGALLYPYPFDIHVAIEEKVSTIECGDKPLLLQGITSYSLSFASASMLALGYLRQKEGISTDETIYLHPLQENGKGFLLTAERQPHRWQEEDYKRLPAHLKEDSGNWNGAPPSKLATREKGILFWHRYFANPKDIEYLTADGETSPGKKIVDLIQGRLRGLWALPLLEQDGFYTTSALHRVYCEAIREQQYSKDNDRDQTCLDAVTGTIHLLSRSRADKGTDDLQTIIRTILQLTEWFLLNRKPHRDGLSLLTRANLMILFYQIEEIGERTNIDMGNVQRIISRLIRDIGLPAFPGILSLRETLERPIDPVVHLASLLIIADPLILLYPFSAESDGADPLSWEKEERFSRVSRGIKFLARNRLLLPGDINRIVWPFLSEHSQKDDACARYSASISKTLAKATLPLLSALKLEGQEIIYATRTLPFDQTIARGADRFTLILWNLVYNAQKKLTAKITNDKAGGISWDGKSVIKPEGDGKRGSRIEIEESLPKYLHAIAEKVKTRGIPEEFKKPDFWHNLVASLLKKDTEKLHYIQWYDLLEQVSGPPLDQFLNRVDRFIWPEEQDLFRSVLSDLRSWNEVFERATRSLDFFTSAGERAINHVPATLVQDLLDAVQQGRTDRIIDIERRFKTSGPGLLPVRLFLLSELSDPSLLENVRERVVTTGFPAAELTTVNAYTDNEETRMWKSIPILPPEIRDFTFLSKKPQKIGWISADLTGVPMALASEVKKGSRIGEEYFVFQAPSRDHLLSKPNDSKKDIVVMIGDNISDHPITQKIIEEQLPIALKNFSGLLCADRQLKLMRVRNDSDLPFITVKVAKKNPQKNDELSWDSADNRIACRDGFIPDSVLDIIASARIFLYYGHGIAGHDAYASGMDLFGREKNSLNTFRLWEKLQTGAPLFAGLFCCYGSGTHDVGVLPGSETRSPLLVQAFTDNGTALALSAPLQFPVLQGWMAFKQVCSLLGDKGSIAERWPNTLVDTKSSGNDIPESCAESLKLPILLQVIGNPYLRILPEKVENSLKRDGQPGGPPGLLTVQVEI